MKFSIPLLVFSVCLIFTSSLLAKEPWYLREVFNGSDHKPEAHQFSGSGELFDCGLEVQELCSDEVRYYNLPVYVVLTVREGVVDEVTFTMDFSSYNLSQLQLNLRKDGFWLSKISYGGDTFDVRREIEARPTEIAEVDKSLIEFINARPSDTPVHSRWRYKKALSPRLELVSDGQEIRLTLVRD